MKRHRPKTRWSQPKRWLAGRGIYVWALMLAWPLSAGATTSESTGAENESPSAKGRNQQDSSTTIEVDGVVTRKGKYSFTLRGLERSYEVFIPNGTPVHLRLTRPEFDWPNRQVRLVLPITAVNGNASDNKTLAFPLPDRVMLAAEFASEQQKRKVMASPVIRLNRYHLSDGPHPFRDSSLVVLGELVPGHRPGGLALNINSSLQPVALGGRNGTLDGFSIVDIQPGAVDVFVTGEFDGEKLNARSIEFAPVGDQTEDDEPGLPRVLFLGDSVSFNYQRPLREAMRGIVNLHHPPTNCGSSNNWRSIHRWLGNFDQDGRQWDVITFNFGLHDAKTTKDAYQTNLKRAIEQLKKTQARLIWVNTTPIPYAFLDSAESARDPQTSSDEEQKRLVERAQGLSASDLVGHLPGRMALQNRWAQEVLAAFPEIAVCDLWSVAKAHEDALLRQWWFGRSYNFEYTHSVPLARELAGAILTSLGRQPDEIHPLDVHAMKIDKDGN